MINNYMGMVFLTENDNDIRGLTKNRTIASTPAGGRYRIIDFSLSNLVNAGIRNVGLFMGRQNSRSLVDHIGNGAPWDLDRKRDGLFLFNFSGGDAAITDIANLENNLEYLYRSKQEKVVVTASYMVCNMDVKAAIMDHEKNDADITIIYKTITDADKSCHNCETLDIDKDGYISGIGRNFNFKKEANISMESFILKKELLLKLICEAAQKGQYTSFKDIITLNVNNLKMKGHEFKGYVKCINSTKEYFNFNMDLLDPRIRRDLFFKNGKIYTKIKDTPPSFLKKNAEVENSLIANGCIVDGKIKNSIISRHVKVEEGAEIENCIILQDCTIEKGAQLKNIIIDKNTVVTKNEELKASQEFPLVIEKKVGINSERFKEFYWPLEDM